MARFAAVDAGGTLPGAVRGVSRRRQDPSPRRNRRVCPESAVPPRCAEKQRTFSSFFASFLAAARPARTTWRLHLTHAPNFSRFTPAERADLAHSRTRRTRIDAQDLRFAWASGARSARTARRRIAYFQGRLGRACWPCCSEKTRQNLGAVARPKWGEPRYPGNPAGSSAGAGPAGVGRAADCAGKRFPRAHGAATRHFCSFRAEAGDRAKTAGFAVQVVWESVTN